MNVAQLLWNFPEWIIALLTDKSKAKMNYSSSKYVQNNELIQTADEDHMINGS